VRNQTYILFALLAGAVGLFVWTRRNPVATADAVGAAADTVSAAPSSIQSTIEDASVSVQEKFGIAWPYPRGQEYQSLFDDASNQYGLPAGLLAAQGWQESRFRPEVIDGTVISSAGAVGIMQLIPRFYPGVDPTDPTQAIPAAAQSLAKYQRQFGAWDLALAAYNWGPGNLSKHLNMPRDTWPQETQDYVNNITNGAGVQLA
jgi:soluble lytic murein transglycosylase-like protein